MTTAPELSVLVCAFDRPERLGRLLADLHRQRGVDAKRWEIWVADNHPQERSRAVVEALSGTLPATRYIAVPRPGKTRALNRLGHLAKAELLHTIDEDHRVPDDYVSAILAAFSSDRISAVTGRIDVDASDAALTFKQDEAPHVFRAPEDFPRAGHGSNLTVRRRVWHEIGGYDRCLGPGTWAAAAEDTDFIYRVLASGRTIRYEPTIRNLHAHGRTEAGAVLDQYFKGRVCFTTKHLLRGDSRPLPELARQIVAFHRHIVGALLRRDLDTAGRLTRRLLLVPVAAAHRIACELGASEEDDPERSAARADGTL